MKIIKIWSDVQIQQDQFQALIQPHIKNLYRFAYRCCQKQTDAEELIQALLLKICPYTTEMGQNEDLKLWLTKSLYRLFIESINKQNRYSTQTESRNAINKTSNKLESKEVSQVTPLFQNASEQEQQQYLQQINKALLTLNTIQRELIVFHDVEGYSLKELEYILDTPIGTLKTRLSRSQQKLRAQLMVPYPERVSLITAKG
ncbi:MAG: RNA polymerase sigma factor [Gammaproteobacteria bacterium]|nr:RNA polymerase sigma factor [Gammaproteobacteria bacterium]